MTENKKCCKKKFLIRKDSKKEMKGNRKKISKRERQECRRKNEDKKCKK